MIGDAEVVVDDPHHIKREIACEGHLGGQDVPQHHGLPVEATDKVAEQFMERRPGLDFVWREKLQDPVQRLAVQPKFI
jgi:hypothetical protein